MSPDNNRTIGQYLDKERKNLHTVLRPSEVESSTLTESAPDTTSEEKIVFYHAEQGKPLATPWQVALARSKMINDSSLGKGIIVDCACGSGIQLAAHAIHLQRAALGIELEPQRALASAVNLQTIALSSRQQNSQRMAGTRVLCGDGRDGKGALETLQNDLNLQQMPEIALLHLDPARPRNSRSHGLDEMAPRLDEIFTGWAPYLSQGTRGPSLLLDLSPRLSHQQRLQVEEMVDSVWPQIDRTWIWTSRGRGRVDRLALWLGSISIPNVARRFVRIPPNLQEESLIIDGGEPILVGDGLPVKSRRPPRKGERVSLLDAALVESGLAEVWLKKVTKSEEIHWGVVEGRRPQIHHDHPLQLEDKNHLLVQATGKIVALAHTNLTLADVDSLVKIALEHDIQKLTVRVSLEPALQPKVQGAIDRQLARRHGKRTAFVVQQPGDEMLLLCIVE
jgi:hypothetical protein